MTHDTERNCPQRSRTSSMTKLSKFTNVGKILEQRLNAVGVNKYFKL